MFAITGLTCLAYAVLALLQMRPDPFRFGSRHSGTYQCGPDLCLASAAGRRVHNRLLMKVTSWTNAAPRPMRFGLH